MDNGHQLSFVSPTCTPGIGLYMFRLSNTFAISSSIMSAPLHFCLRLRKPLTARSGSAVCPSDRIEQEKVMRSSVECALNHRAQRVCIYALFFVEAKCDTYPSW